MSVVFPGYPSSASDEAVGVDGRLREGYAVLEPALERLGVAGLPAAAAALAAEHRARGVAVGTWSDGRQELHPQHLDPLPRVLTPQAWARLAAGVEQRHRALNAFLADVYRAAGRRRSDPDRSSEIVRAGRLPDWAVAHSPGRDPQAVGLAWPGQPRAAVAGTDVVRTAPGNWLVVRDDLRAPSGLGSALAARDSCRVALPDLFTGASLVEPVEAMPLLREALQAAAPATARSARLAVLGAGEDDDDRFEQRLLADALGAPLVRPSDIWPRMGGGIEATVSGERYPIDVLYLRVDEAAIDAYPTPTGQPIGTLLTDAVRAGRLGLANVPGNGVADDASTFAWVPEMIRFYLGEEPLLPAVPTWLLADPAQWAQVRDRLHELVLIPVAGYGGGAAVSGPSCSAAELAELQAEVAAAPHRFVAQEPVASSTAPTLIGGVAAPRHVDLRVFSVAGTSTRALPAPLTRVALAEGSTATAAGPTAGSKDTWLLR
jgi:carboxylate-amine ligase